MLAVNAAFSNAIDSDVALWRSQVLSNGGTVNTGRAILLSQLVRGLKADGIWAKLDRLWILAAENTYSALVDLKARATATNTNSVFARNKGYRGDDGGTSSKWIDTGFNPSTASGLYAQNSAHFSVWNTGSYQNANSGAQMGVSNGGTTYSEIYAVYGGDGNVYGRINEFAASGGQGTTSNLIGHWLVNRSGASATQIYYNGASFSSPNSTSAAMSNGNFAICATNYIAGSMSGSNNHVAAASIGGSLTSTEAANFYTHLNRCLEVIVRTPSLILHGDGADASTTITDSSTYAWTMTLGGNAQLDTAQSKWGSASVLFDGTGDFMYVPETASSSSSAWMDGDYTIHFWVRFNSLTGLQLFFTNFGASALPQYSVQIFKENTTDVLKVNADNALRITGTTALSANTWYHVALTRANRSLKLWLNGTQEGSTYTNANVTGIDDNRPLIGIDTDGASNPFNGWLDEYVIVNGTALWNAAFTVPDGPTSWGA